MGREKWSGARLLLMAACFLFLLACGGVDSRVVKVTDVEVAKDLYAGLKRDDVAKIEELKRSITQKDAGKDAGGVAVEKLLDKTPTFTVTEYLAKYPESKVIGEDYKIGGYDVLSITVYEEKDLTIES
ncbi:MAG: hypothetical protein Q8O11_04995, partial [Syntrophales bacterium]|nr:hypothetical protein [Syntrophales bacterium]